MSVRYFIIAVDEERGNALGSEVTPTGVADVCVVECDQNTTIYVDDRHRTESVAKTAGSIAFALVLNL
jgi:hypothetical protein